MEDFIQFKKSVNIADYTLVLPSVAVGNVGQLTIDLLIHTHSFEKLATVWHPAIIPVVGGNPFTGDSTDLCTACELYVKKEVKIVALQLRSSIEPKLALDFFECLKQSIFDLKFKQVVILTSSFAHEMHDVSSSVFRYITNEQEIIELLENLKIPSMDMTISGRYVVHGAGFAVKLHELLMTSQVKNVVLIKYSSEGDNRPDAMQMLNLLCGFLKDIEKQDIKFPVSWKYVFGNPAPIGIY